VSPRSLRLSFSSNKSEDSSSNMSGNWRVSGEKSGFSEIDTRVEEMAESNVTCMETKGEEGVEEEECFENSVQVLCRFRPQNRKEVKAGGKTTYRTNRKDPDFVQLVDPEDDDNMYNFKFDRVFNADATQDSVYEHLGRPIVNAVLQGYNGTVLAYGQTGSGKTYTMEGPSLHEEDLQGLIPRMMVSLFKEIRRKPVGITFVVTASMIEIYMERVNDLLEPSNTNLRIRENADDGIWIEGCCVETLSHPKEFFDVLKRGQQNRSTASTRMNSDSSRSHSLMIVAVHQHDINANKKRCGRMFLTDLAGSEKVRKSGAVGKRLKEAQSINQSLSALGNVIKALTCQQIGTYVPYRDSKLTRILQQSFGGNSKTILVLCLSPSSVNFHESVSTLRFGSRAKLVENQARINEEYSAAELKLLLAKAQKEIAMLRSRNKPHSGGSQQIRNQLHAMQNRLGGKDPIAIDLKHALALKEKECKALRKKVTMLSHESERRIRSLDSDLEEKERELEDHRNRLSANEDTEERFKNEIRQLSTVLDHTRSKAKKRIELLSEKVTQLVESVDETHHTKECEILSVKVNELEERLIKTESERDQVLNQLSKNMREREIERHELIERNRLLQLQHNDLLTTFGLQAEAEVKSKTIIEVLHDELHKTRHRCVIEQLNKIEQERKIVSLKEISKSTQQELSVRKELHSKTTTAFRLTKSGMQDFIEKLQTDLLQLSSKILSELAGARMESSSLRTRQGRMQRKIIDLSSKRYEDRRWHFQEAKGLGQEISLLREKLLTTFSDSTRIQSELKDIVHESHVANRVLQAQVQKMALALRQSKEQWFNCVLEHQYELRAETLQRSGLLKRLGCLKSQYRATEVEMKGVQEENHGLRMALLHQVSEFSAAVLQLEALETERGTLRQVLAKKSRKVREMESSLEMSSTQNGILVQDLFQLKCELQKIRIDGEHKLTKEIQDRSAQDAAHRLESHGLRLLLAKSCAKRRSVDEELVLALERQGFLMTLLGKERALRRDVKAEMSCQILRESVLKVRLARTRRKFMISEREVAAHKISLSAIAVPLLKERSRQRFDLNAIACENQGLRNALLRLQRKHSFAQEHRSAEIRAAEMLQSTLAMKLAKMTKKSNLLSSALQAENVRLRWALQKTRARNNSASQQNEQEIYALRLASSAIRAHCGWLKKLLREKGVEVTSHQILISVLVQKLGRSRKQIQEQGQRMLKETTGAQFRETELLMKNARQRKSMKCIQFRLERVHNDEISVMRLQIGRLRALVRTSDAEIHALRAQSSSFILLLGKARSVNSLLCSAHVIEGSELRLAIGKMRRFLQLEAKNSRLESSGLRTRLANEIKDNKHLKENMSRIENAMINTASELYMKLGYEKKQGALLRCEISGWQEQNVSLSMRCGDLLRKLRESNNEVVGTRLEASAMRLLVGRRRIKERLLNSEIHASRAAESAHLMDLAKLSGFLDTAEKKTSILNIESSLLRIRLGNLQKKLREADQSDSCQGTLSALLKTARDQCKLRAESDSTISDLATEIRLQRRETSALRIMLATKIKESKAMASPDENLAWIFESSNLRMCLGKSESKVRALVSEKHQLVRLLQRAKAELPEDTEAPEDILRSPSRAVELNDLNPVPEMEHLLQGLSKLRFSALMVPKLERKFQNAQKEIAGMNQDLKERCNEILRLRQAIADSPAQKLVSRLRTAQEEVRRLSEENELLEKRINEVTKAHREAEDRVAEVFINRQDQTQIVIAHRNEAFEKVALLSEEIEEMQFELRNAKCKLKESEHARAQLTREVGHMREQLEAVKQVANDFHLERDQALRKLHDVEAHLMQSIESRKGKGVCNGEGRVKEAMQNFEKNLLKLEKKLKDDRSVFKEHTASLLQKNATLRAEIGQERHLCKEMKQRLVEAELAQSSLSKVNMQQAKSVQVLQADVERLRSQLEEQEAVYAGEMQAKHEMLQKQEEEIESLRKDEMRKEDEFKCLEESLQESLNSSETLLAEMNETKAHVRDLEGICSRLQNERQEAVDRIRSIDRHDQTTSFSPDESIPEILDSFKISHMLGKEKLLQRNEELENVLGSLERAHCELKEELFRSKDGIALLEHQNIKASSRIELLENALENLNSDKSKTIAVAREHERHSWKLQEQVVRLEQQLSFARSVTDLERNSHENEIEFCREKIIAAERMVQQRDALQREVTSLNQLVQESEEEISAVRLENEKTKEKLMLLDSLENGFTEMESRNKELEEKSSFLSSKFELSQQQKGHLEERIQQVVTEFDDILSGKEEQLKELDLSLKDSAEEARMLEAENSRLKDSCQRHQEILRDFETLEERHDLKCKEVKSIVEAKQQQEKHARNLQRQLDEVEKSFSDSKRSLDQQNAKVARLQQEIHEFTKKNETLNILVENLQNEQKEVPQLKFRSKKQAEELKKNSCKIIALEQLKSELLQHIDAIQMDKESLREQLSSESKARETLEIKNDALSNETTALQVRRDELEDKLASETSTREQLQQELNTIHSRHSQRESRLVTRIRCLQEEKSLKEAQHQQELNEVKAKLKSKWIRKPFLKSPRPSSKNENN